MAYYPMKMRSGCGICGTFMDARFGFSPEDWLHDVFAIHGPKSPDTESPGPGESEQFTWYDAKVNPFGHLRDLSQLIGSSTTNSNVYHGFHKSCISIAHQFIAPSNTTLKSFCDIWFRLAQHYAGGMGPYDRRLYYLPYKIHPLFSTWWFYDPLDIPRLTPHLLEKVKCRRVSPLSAETSRFRNNLSSLPQEVLDEITDYFRCGTEPVGSQPTYLLPQHFWKQFIVKIPFLWDLEVRRFQQFTDWSVDNNKEWDWELLFRQLMERPVAVSENDNTQEAKSFEFWDYRQTGLEAPPGLTNRRRIWQIFNDMDEGKTFIWRDGWLL
ncbi:hypothetical protein HYE68_004131 [Fusarium pseudograminearum]|nr:hypothetical protein HYE68_004131 [Fusarium pseudograminearum]